MKMNTYSWTYLQYACASTSTAGTCLPKWLWAWLAVSSVTSQIKKLCSGGYGKFMHSWWISLLSSQTQRQRTAGPDLSDMKSFFRGISWSPVHKSLQQEDRGQHMRMLQHFPLVKSAMCKHFENFQNSSSGCEEIAVLKLWCIVFQRYQLKLAC